MICKHNLIFDKIYVEGMKKMRNKNMCVYTHTKLYKFLHRNFLNSISIKNSEYLILWFLGSIWLKFQQQILINAIIKLL